MACADVYGTPRVRLKRALIGVIAALALLWLSAIPAANFRVLGRGLGELCPTASFPG